MLKWSYRSDLFQLSVSQQNTNQEEFNPNKQSLYSKRRYHVLIYTNGDWSLKYNLEGQKG